ncbi:hypothetical protein CA615_06730 [Methanosphaera stadtmanae]|uniref:Uncharacterized protein n=2 Tax=Methanosphaera stadtmanae TaxID=2317 RepID=A0A328PX81_9EURY|nr:hypothetical protein CA615_06730 [Methanosphaera stadtmanae]
MVIIMISIIIIAFVGCISYLFIQNNQLENQIQEINSTKNNTTQDNNTQNNKTDNSVSSSTTTGNPNNKPPATQDSSYYKPTGGTYADGVSSPNTVKAKLDSKDYYTTGTDYYRGSDGNYYYTEYSNGRVVDSGRAYKTSSGQVAKA